LLKVALNTKKIKSYGENHVLFWLGDDVIFVLIQYAAGLYVYSAS
jgi:hypothetical protein